MNVVGLIVVALLSIFIIVKAASYLILSISSYARKTGISDHLIGFIIVGIGTSLPELSTGVMSSLVKKGQLILGDLIGASLIDLTLVFGIILVLSKKLRLQKHKLSHLLLMTAIVIVPLAFGLDGDLSRFDGGIIFVLYLIYIFVLVRNEGDVGELKKDVKLKYLWKDMFIFLGALVALLLSARWLVFSTVQLSSIVNIPLYVVGLFFMAFCTTMPEIVVSIKAVHHKHKDIAIGNLFGSIVTNLAFVLGISAMINPITFDKISVGAPSLFLIVSIIMGIVFLSKKELNWKHGVVLLSMYILFIISQLLVMKVF